MSGDSDERQSVLDDIEWEAEYSLQSMKSVVALGLWPIEAFGALRSEARDRVASCVGATAEDVERCARRWDEALQAAVAALDEAEGAGTGSVLAKLDEAFLELEAMGFGTSHAVYDGRGRPRTDLDFAREEAKKLKGFFFSCFYDVAEAVDRSVVLPIYYASYRPYETPGQFKKLKPGGRPAWADLKVSKRHLKDVGAALDQAMGAMRRAGLDVKRDARWRHRLLVKAFRWDGRGDALRSGAAWIRRDCIGSGPWGDRVDESLSSQVSGEDVGSWKYIVPPKVSRPRRQELADIASAGSVEIPFLTGFVERSEICEAAEQKALEEFNRELSERDMELVFELLWKRYRKLARQWKGPSCYARMVEALDGLSEVGIYAHHAPEITSAFTQMGAYEAITSGKRAREREWTGTVYYSLQCVEDAILGGGMALSFVYEGTDLEDAGLAEASHRARAEGRALSAEEFVAAYRGDQDLQRPEDAATVKIGRAIEAALLNAGFDIEWNGTADEVIFIKDFVWDRRLE